MSVVGAVALAVLLGRYLLDGSAADLGTAVTATAPAFLLLGVAWGMRSRWRWPYLTEAVLLALLVPARGPLCDLVTALLPVPWGGLHMAAALSLTPVGLALGRHLVLARPERSLILPLLGWAAGEGLILLGGTGWLPGPLTGFAIAGALAVLGELGPARRRDGDAGAPGAMAWAGLMPGLAVGLSLPVLWRVVSSYAEPPVHGRSDVVLALVLPALLVALPAAWLGLSERQTRLWLALGGLVLAGALWHMTAALGVYVRASEHVALSSKLRRVALDWPLLGEWRAWLLYFTGPAALACGVLARGLSRRAAGPLVAGLGLGVLGEQWIGVSPALAPLELLLLASGAAGATAAAVTGRAGLLAAPLLVVPLLTFPKVDRVGFDGVRRVGDYAADAWSRTLAADVALFSTDDLDNVSVQGRRAARTSFTGREPMLTLGGPVSPPPLLARVDEGDTLERRFGVRIAGATMHADHLPTGPEGSTGRLLRLLASPGPAAVLGLGAELIAADLVAAGLGEPRLISTPIPLGEETVRLVLAELDGSGDAPGGAWTPPQVGQDPLRDIQDLPRGGLMTVVLAPERVAWPASGQLLTRTTLARLASTLAPEGRCLAWLDTTDLDGRALAARLAAFGAEFGQRSLALVEPRELDAPFVLLLGWVSDAGAPTAQELAQRLPVPDATGWRTRVTQVDDLGSLLLLDGPGLASTAREGPVLERSRPVPSARGAGTGWRAVAAVRNEGPRLSRSIAGAGDVGPVDADVVEGLALHAGLFYRLELLRAVSVVEAVDDVDWAAIDAEVACYARAAARDPGDPLLNLAAAALLEPLLREDELTRFSRAFGSLGGETLSSWRVALQQATALEKSLLPDQAARARDRAAALAPPGRGD